MRRTGAADPTLGGSYRNLQVLLRVLHPCMAASAPLLETWATEV